jgi:uncharacterized membrane protein YqjE
MKNEQALMYIGWAMFLGGLAIMGLCYLYLKVSPNEPEKSALSQSLRKQVIYLFWGCFLIVGVGVSILWQVYSMGRK